MDTGGVDGNFAVGAFGIVNRTGMLFVMIVFGVTQGMQPILGFNYGAKQWQRVKKTLKIGVIVGVIITTLGFVVAEFFPQQISRLFTTDSTLINMSINGFRISFICYSVVGAQVVIQNFFQSIGKPNISIFLSLTRQLIFLIPTLLIFPHLFGLNGVWISLSVSDFMAFAVAAVTMFIIVKREDRIFKIL
mgnify:FL=1